MGISRGIPSFACDLMFTVLHSLLIFRCLLLLFNVVPSFYYSLVGQVDDLVMIPLVLFLPQSAFIPSKSDFG